MTSWKKSTRLLLLTALTLSLAAALFPNTLFGALQLAEVQPLDVRQQAGPSGSEDWIATPAARARSRDGQCAEGYECLELCVSGEATGTFQCWPKNQW